MDHTHLGLNEVGRDFIIGDLHGEMELLELKMKQVYFDKEKDRLFSVGDLIDRGPESYNALKLIYENWFYPVRGNHEDMMIDVLLGDYNGMPTFDDHWVNNGGAWYKDVDRDELVSVAKHFKDTIPYAITVTTKKGNIGICHAEPPTYDWKDVEALTEARKEVMLWARNKIRHDNEQEILNVVKTYHGHTPVRDVIQLGNMNFIDTGAFYTKKLTMVEL